LGVKRNKQGNPAFHPSDLTLAKRVKPLTIMFSPLISCILQMLRVAIQKQDGHPGKFSQKISKFVLQKLPA
jgi:hypothetical protein